MLKLVRNKIGARVAAQERKARKVHELVYPAMLRDKLREEADEVSWADGVEELTAELADVMSVVAAIRRRAGIPAWRVWWVRFVKWVRLGGFADRWAISVKDGKEFREKESAIVDPY